MSFAVTTSPYQYPLGKYWQVVATNPSLPPNGQYPFDVDLRKASNFNSAHPQGDTLEAWVLNFKGTQSSGTGRQETILEYYIKNSTYPNGILADKHLVGVPYSGDYVETSDFIELASFSKWGEINTITVKNTGSWTIIPKTIELYVAYNATGTYTGIDAKEQYL